MLQHRLLVQLHTYVCLMASPSQDEPRLREDEGPFTTRVSGRSLSTPNALSFGSPSRNPFPGHQCGGVGGGRAPGEHLGVVAKRYIRVLLGMAEGLHVATHAHTASHAGGWVLPHAAFLEEGRSSISLLSCSSGSEEAVSLGS